jgi:beta-aspartyl-peptidase (threonine type)
MKKMLSVLLMYVLLILPVAAQKGSYADMKQLQSPQSPRLGFILHGGAGVIKKGTLTPEREAEYRRKLEEAVLAGYKALQDGKSSLDAIEIAIRILEDSPLFNAGKGAVFTNDGKNELDSSIMDGKTLGAGAAAGLHKVKNPITLARAVMEKSPHVMMVGDGAEKFAKEQGIELVPEKYFWTQERWDALQKILKEDREKQKKPGAAAFNLLDDFMLRGNPLYATNKKYGRVGDAPIIGAGTYANNDTCGVSATGWGEYFIRVGVARDISALMEYRLLPIQQAADTVMQKVGKLGGDGGVVAMDKFGNMAISFNSEGMYRAYINAEGKSVVEIYKD